MIQFGVLGAAKITPRALVYPCVDEPNAIIRAIAARERDRAEKMAEWARIDDVMDDYQAVVDHPKCNAIYIPLPISHHYEWTLKALAAGKHVLCEKSFASNAAEAEEMAQAGRDAGLVVMDAFHYRYHPVFRRAKEIVESGVLGTLREIDAEFSVPGPIPASDIRMRYETGGGVSMDIGCYPTSWVRHLTNDEPEEVSAVAEQGPPDVDVRMVATMRFASGVVATATGDMTDRHKSYVYRFEVRGDAGTLAVTNPLVPQNGHLIELTIGDRTTPETLDRRSTYGYQLDAFLAAVQDGQRLFTDADDAVKQARLIDRCYQAAGMRLRGEGDM
ncbi:MAG: Gfo/Idh/MocA family oxidoreductase [Acidobacteriota bacterium]|nr:Gfo/Idh/MocA family oxidoreductase [Acidobacteriota bacterium]